MPTTQEYLIDLVKQKNKLVDCVSGCVECSKDETLNSIIPKLENYLAEDREPYEIGFEAGEKSAYDTFWDKYQDFGRRVVYQYMFCGQGWNSTTFRPKYDMQPTNAEGMFRNATFDWASNVDLVSILENCDVVLDFSKCQYLSYAFYYAQFTRLGVIDATSAYSIAYTFTNSGRLHTIEKVIVHENLQYTDSFAGCSNLENLIIEGSIGKNGFNTKDCIKLSKASHTSIINALSATTTGLTVTFSLTAVNKAFETSEGANDGSSSGEWTDLIATKSNWTISLL